MHTAKFFLFYSYLSLATGEGFDAAALPDGREPPQLGRGIEVEKAGMSFLATAMDEGGGEIFADRVPRRSRGMTGMVGLIRVLRCGLFGRMSGWMGGIGKLERGCDKRLAIGCNRIAARHEDRSTSSRLERAREREKIEHSFTLPSVYGREVGDGGIAALCPHVEVPTLSICRF